MTELVTGKALPNVVVTGIAMTTALATDAEGTWKLLLDSQSGIRTLTDPFVEEFKLPVRIGGHLLEEFDHHLTRVELRTSVENKRSRSVAERLGFAYEGILPAGLRFSHRSDDVALYGVTAESWRTPTRRSR